MVTDSSRPSSNGFPRPRLAFHASSRALWVVVAVVGSLIVYLSSLQIDVDGSVHRYTTDVGEIQNALPRWGLIHHSGYPLYTAMGSLFVTVLRIPGIEPAAGASLYSMLWGVVSAGLVVVLAQELGAPGPAAALGALAGALSTSMWVFSSVAEVHTLTIVFSLLTLIFALQFGRTGGRRELLLLALAFSQGVMHQRSIVILAPAVLVLIWPQLRALWRGLGPAIGVSLLAPLTYLYMPFRVWTGATWVFGSPGTWAGFWEMVFDNRATYLFQTHGDLEAWRQRAQTVLDILADDMLWPLLVVGLAALILPVRKKGEWRESLGISLAWIFNLLLVFIIWRGKVGDAQLAAKLPITTLAGVGLALALDWLRLRRRWLGIAAGIALVVALVGWGWKVRPFVLSIVRDPSAKEVIEIASQVAPPPDNRPTTLVTSWGRDYWALVYAQEYRGQLPGLNLVDHNADLRAISDRGDRTLILAKIFHVFPVSWWEERFGRLYLASAAPGVLEISRTPPVNPADRPAGVALDMENGLRLLSAAVGWVAQDRLLLTVYWQAEREVALDYSVACHLVSHELPTSGNDILAQADRAHPVDGWYPTSRWSRGEIVRDLYAIEVPEGSAPVAVRIALYRTDPEAGFVNSPWYTLSLPER